MIEKVKTEFRKRFGGDPALYSSPGRINLIGEHTDYNLGFVLPGAIDKAIYVAIRPNGAVNARLYSIDYDTELSVSLDGEKPSQQWARYVFGVVQEMRKRGATVEGFDCAFGGDVPLGAGLSSSAALESAFGYALNDLFGTGFSRAELAEIGQMTEHNYIDLKCGIMDQFASLFGRKGEVIKLDCRSLQYEMVPFDPKGYKVVLVDSMVKHTLAATEYNVRREQCGEGVSVVARHEEGVESLRDVTMEMLDKYKSEMEPVVYKRCAFVINENKRLLDGCEALKKDDYRFFGRMMYGSHDGLSKEYEVSCAELDFIVEVARRHESVVGARMMGGGFGGCVIHLIEEADYENYLADVKLRFNERFKMVPRIIDVVIGDGAHKIE